MRLILIIFALLLSACADNQAIQQEEKVKEQKMAAEKASKTEALRTFVATYHPGWVLQGTSDPFLIFDSDPIDLHLTNQTTEKIETILLRQFTRPNGETYWLAYKIREDELKRMEGSSTSGH